MSEISEDKLETQHLIEENTANLSETVVTNLVENIGEKSAINEKEKVATGEEIVSQIVTSQATDPLIEEIKLSSDATVDVLKVRRTSMSLDCGEPPEDSSQTIETTVDVKNTSDFNEELENYDVSTEKTKNETKDVSSSPAPLKDESKDKEAESKQFSNDKYAEHVTYIEDGTAIYTDPNTKYQYKWCAKENNWIPKDAAASTNPYENEHYKWCSETQKWIPKQTHVTETEHYKWNAEKNEWVAKVKETSKKPAEIVYDIDENGQRTYTDKDGTIFFWDVKKNAWFPKIDEDFMARYQMNYGFIDNTSESEKEKEKLILEASMEKEKELDKMVEEAKASEEASKEDFKGGIKRKQPQEQPKWFEIDPEHNTKVYVSNLPLDITLDEFAEVMGKCGMIMRDPQTQKYKLKLYTEADGQIKGDGLCDYIKVESVDLALNILDEYDLRGHKLRVQRAQFQMRGEYNPALKPKRKKKDKEKLAKIKEKLFDWRPEKMRGERLKHEKTVIIKNLFHPDLFEKEVQLILDYQNDLREECSKCGTVRKVVIYDRHSEGVAQVNMASPEEADLVIQMMQGRFFGKRQLTAEHWDGKTKYKIEETEEEIQKRLNKWDKYLESEEHKKIDSKHKVVEIESLKAEEPSDVAEKANLSEAKSSEESSVLTREPLKALKTGHTLAVAEKANISEASSSEEASVLTKEPLKTLKADKPLGIAQKVNISETSNTEE